MRLTGCLFLAGCLSPLILLTSCGDLVSREPARENFLAMDTYMTFTLYGEGAEDAIADAKEEILRLEKLWSVTDPESEIYAVNHGAESGSAADHDMDSQDRYKSVMVSPETADLVAFALKMAEETKGALDPTIYPALTAWGFTAGEYRIPAKEELDELLKRVDYKKVRLEENEINLPEGMMLDLGAVGKGYAGDLLAKLLAEKGINSALLDIGGNIQAIGKKPDGSEWRLGLRAPGFLEGPSGKGDSDTGSEGILGSLSVSDAAVVTSGAYERYFIGEDGKRYGHIIDPVTGYPAENGLLSVTVIAGEGKLCDALSTALYVMGAGEAADYWQEHRNFDMILVTEDKRVFLTEGLEDRFSLDKAYQDWTIEVIRAGFGD